MSYRGDECGAALAIALVVLAAVSILGIAGTQTATLQLAMARNSVHRQAAFEAAASGIELALAAAPFPIMGTKTISRTFGQPGYSAVVANIEIQGVTPVPVHGFSIGTASTGVRAYHFEIESIGTAPRNAESVQRQGFFVIGPE